MITTRRLSVALTQNDIILDYHCPYSRIGAGLSLGQSG